MGDCVYLKSPEKLPYIALVEWVGETQIRCRWFYRFGELPAHLRKSVVDTCCCEVFLSAHQDLNHMSSVIQTCAVARKLVDGPVVAASPTMLIDDHIVCRYAYDIPKKSLSLVSDWRDDHIVGKCDWAETSTRPAPGDCTMTTSHSQQPRIDLNGKLQIFGWVYLLGERALHGLVVQRFCVLAGAPLDMSTSNESGMQYYCAEHEPSHEGSHHLQGK